MVTKVSETVPLDVEQKHTTAVVTDDVITLYCSPAIFPSDETTKNLSPQVIVGGSCSTKWSQFATPTGTSAHS